MFKDKTLRTKNALNLAYRHATNCIVWVSAEVPRELVLHFQAHLHHVGLRAVSFLLKFGYSRLYCVKWKAHYAHKNFAAKCVTLRSVLGCSKLMYALHVMLNTQGTVSI